MVNFQISSEVMGADKSGAVVFRNANTIGYLFINTGNTIVYLNNIALSPNGFLKTYEPGAADMTQWRVNFQAPFQVGTPQLTVLIYSKL
jgi:hypothetical protein